MLALTRQLCRTCLVEAQPCLGRASPHVFLVRPFASKDAKKEAKTVKKPKKKNKAVAMTTEEESKSNKDFNMMLSICDSPRRAMPEFSEERKKEMFEIGRRYNQEMSRQHNRSNWDLQMKMDLKTAAMKALPPDQLEYAMNVTMEDCAFPLDFRHPTYSPPIKGYNAMDYATESS